MTAGPTQVSRSHLARRHPTTFDALAWEVRKLVSQARCRWTLLAAALAPLPIVAVIHSQPRPPKDTLFGRFATDNGFAMALLVLGFAGQWILPLLTAIVAGDIFASEDSHGTWKTVLTRSVGRGRLFTAKAITALGFGCLALIVLAASTMVASYLVVGRQPLTGLGGQLILPGQAAQLVAEAWASALGPTIAFTCLALLLSVVSRNPAVGVAAPVVIAMAMQLLGAVGAMEPARPYLPTTGFETWHGLFAAPVFRLPMASSFLACAAWSAACLTLAAVALRRRDITGG